MMIIYTGAGSGGTNLRFTVVSPSTTEINWVVPVYLNAAGNPVYGETSYTAPVRIAWGNGVAIQFGLQIVGTVNMGSTGGPVQFWWAQGTSGVTNTRLWSGSRMTLHQVG
jgi:hypothetical protein